jgi:hypothetical protein
MSKKWKMPAWMEPYRDSFCNTGGNSIEELMNDRSTNIANNAVRVALITAVDAQVGLLCRLRERKVLSGGCAP